MAICSCPQDVRRIAHEGSWCCVYLAWWVAEGGRDWCGEGSDDGEEGEEEEEDGVLSAFLCPITMEVMRDPVVVETGHAFEREAIARWFSECASLGAAPRCPVTMEVVDGADVKPVVALRAAIEEWTSRRETAALRRACRWLTKAASEKEALRGLDAVMRGWKLARVGKRVVRRDGMVPMVAAMLRNGSARVRLKALQALREFAREDDEYRDSVSEGDRKSVV